MTSPTLPQIVELSDAQIARLRQSVEFEDRADIYAAACNFWQRLTKHERGQPPSSIRVRQGTRSKRVARPNPYSPPILRRGDVTTEDGRSPSGRATQATPEAPTGLRHPVSVPNAGEFVVYNTGSDWRPHAFARVTKVTAQMTYLATGTYNARRINSDSVVATFSGEEEAHHLVQALDGAYGTFKDRRWKADAERTRRVSEAHGAFQKTAARLIAQAIDARRAATAKTGAVHESAVGNADAPDIARDKQP